MKRISITICSALAIVAGMLFVFRASAPAGAQGSAPVVTPWVPDRAKENAPVVGEGPQFEFSKACPTPISLPPANRMHLTPAQEFDISMYVVRAKLVEDKGPANFVDLTGIENAIPPTTRVLRFETLEVLKGDAPKEFVVLSPEGRALGLTWAAVKREVGQESFLFLSPITGPKDTSFLQVSSSGWYDIVGDRICAQNNEQVDAFKHSMIPVPQTIGDLLARIKDGAAAAILPTAVVPSDPALLPKPGPATAVPPMPTYDPALVAPSEEVVAAPSEDNPNAVKAP